MVSWEDFAAFGDIAELEHVCDLLQDRAAAVLHGADLSDFTGKNSYLRKRLARQDRESLRLLENERPGLYQRTWISFLFGEVSAQLDALNHVPSKAEEIVPSLLLNLHKVLIAAHDIFDSSHRASLIARAFTEGIRKGFDEASVQQSAKASAASVKSHQGREELRRSAHRMFMDGGPWQSIAEAVQMIAPKLVKRRDVSRPLAESNAQRTVRDWLSEYIAGDPTAAEKLTEAARKRLKKPATSTVARNRIR